MSKTTIRSIEVHCINSLAIISPQNHLNEKFIGLWNGLESADPHFDIPQYAELLLDTNVYSHLLLPGVMNRLGSSAQRTLFG